MRSQRGTAMLEMIVMGFAVVMLVLVSVSTVARVAEATADVHSAAQGGAMWVARHGSTPPGYDDTDITIVQRSTFVEVTATRDVVLVDVAGRRLTTTVHATVQVPVSAYRSAP